MSDLLNEYLRMGLSDIIVLDHTWHEEAGGSQAEDTTETVVARKGEAFLRIKVLETVTFGWGAKRWFGVSSEEEITKKQYLTLALGKEKIDSTEAVKKIQDSASHLKRMDEFLERIEEMAPNCGECKSKLEAKSGKFGPFWGCPRFPKCRGTAKMASEAKKLYDRWYKGEV